jgi:hypothetical protein
LNGRLAWNLEQAAAVDGLAQILEERFHTLFDLDLLFGANEE